MIAADPRAVSLPVDQGGSMSKLLFRFRRLESLCASKSSPMPMADLIASYSADLLLVIASYPCFSSHAFQLASLLGRSSSQLLRLHDAAVHIAREWVLYVFRRMDLPV